MTVLKKGKGEAEDRRELKRGEGVLLDMRWFLELLQ